MKEFNPLPDDFLDTQEVMSILQIPKSATPVDGVIRAKASAPFRIYKKNFIKGPIKIKLTFPPKTVGTRLILFYALDPSGPKEPSCGGELTLLSEISGPYYKDCEASSTFPGGQNDC